MTARHRRSTWFGHDLSHEDAATWFIALERLARSVWWPRLTRGGMSDVYTV
jgi:hypothetical protein